MSAFLSRLEWADATDHDSAERILSAPLIYQSDLAEQTFTVPAGFQTDGNSTPRLPLLFWLTGDTAHAAAVLHDWLYYAQPVDREMADDILFEACLVRQVPHWRAWSIWFGVRLGGAAHWRARPWATPLSTE